MNNNKCVYCHSIMDAQRRKTVQDKTDLRWFHVSCLIDDAIGKIDDDPDDFDRVGENTAPMPIRN